MPGAGAELLVSRVAGAGRGAERVLAAPPPPLRAPHRGPAGGAEVGGQLRGAGRLARSTILGPARLGDVLVQNCV